MTTSMTPSEPPALLNEVRLTARVTRAPDERELPSGDRVVLVGVCIPRPGRAGARPGAVDALDCTAWSAKVRRTVSSWRVGDIVTVEGSVRRRFFRAGGGAASRYEVEVSAARRLWRFPGA